MPDVIKLGLDGEDLSRKISKALALFSKLKSGLEGVHTSAVNQEKALNKILESLRKQNERSVKQIEKNVQKRGAATTKEVTATTAFFKNLKKLSDARIAADKNMTTRIEKEMTKRSIAVGKEAQARVNATYKIAEAERQVTARKAQVVKVTAEEKRREKAIRDFHERLEKERKRQETVREREGKKAVARLSELAAASRATEEKIRQQLEQSIQKRIALREKEGQEAVALLAKLAAASRAASRTARQKQITEEKKIIAEDLAYMRKAEQQKRAERDKSLAKAVAFYKKMQALVAARGVARGFGPVSTRASTAELNKFAAAQTRLATVVNRSGISIKRSQEIIALAIRKPALAFIGAEAQIAAAARRLKGVFSTLGKSAGTVMGRMARGYNNLGKTGKTAANNLVFSWKGLARLFLVQQMHLLITRITFAMREAFTATIDFQRRISEIRTIAQDNQLAFGTWATRVRELASQFGRTGADVAEGAYQTLSNQVAKGTEVFTFMEEALRFSRAAVASTQDSVNLLTSAINSFGLSATDVTHVAGVLFKTIELGRIRASDMADTLGRLGRIAAATGLSLEETAASVQVMTIQGLRFQRASTFIINLIKGMLKPSTALREELNKLGFETGESAFRALELAGTMRLLDKAIQGNIGRAAELFPNLRGLQGVLGLTGGSLEKLAENIEKTTASSETYNRAVAISFESAGDKMSRAINSVKIEFEKAAESIVKQVISITEYFDVNLVRSILNVVKIIGVLASGAIMGSLVIAIVGLNLALAGAGGLIAVLTGSAGIAAAIAATIAYFVLFSESVEAAERRIGIAIKERINKSLKLEKDALGREKQGLINIIKLRGRLRALQGRRERAQVIETINLAEKESIRLGEILKQSASTTNKIFSAAITKVKNEIKRLRGIVEAGKKFIFTLSQKIDEKLFELKLEDLDIPGKIDAIRKKIEALRSVTLTLTDPEDDKQSRINIERMIELTERINTLQKEFNKEREKGIKSNIKLEKQIAKSRQKADEIAVQTQRKIRQLLLQRARLESGLGRRRISTGGGATAVAIRQEKERTRRKNILTKIANIDKRIAEAQADGNKKRAEAISQTEQFKNSMVTISDALREQVVLQRDYIDLLNLASEVERRREEKVAKAVAEEKKKQVALEEQANAAKILLKSLLGTKLLTGKGKLVGDPKATLADFDQASTKLEGLLKKSGLDVQFQVLTDLAKKRANLQEQLDARLKLKETAADEKKQQNQLKKIEEIHAQRLKDIEEIARIRINVETKIALLQKATLGPVQKLLSKDLTGSQKKLIETLGGQRRGPIFGKGVGQGGSDFLIAPRNIIEQIKKVTRAVAEQRIDATKARQELQDLFALLSRMKFSTLTTEYILNLQASLGKLVTVTNTLSVANAQFEAFSSKLVRDAGTAAKSVFDLRKEIEAMQKQVLQGMSGPAKPKALGGFAAQGADTQAAILSPGEFVVNSAAARKFKNQLLSMNNGMVPRFAQGGFVRNVDVGGINVSVKGGDTSEVTIKEIGRGLKRALRRGVISF